MINKLAFFLLAFSSLTLNAAEQTSQESCSVVEKTEQKARKFLSSNKIKKTFKKVKNAIVEKKDELTQKVSESQLSEQQKNGIYEIFDAVDNLN